ncbi:thermonuclease family protein [Mycobacterium sp. 236(2023)]|nr:thermonuclease family protein [Mycobacterium sp. 236(2023)]MDG4668023.1 thermonuclease family protein [Mycobacterium sp. 236(2023)]
MSSTADLTQDTHDRYGRTLAYVNLADGRDFAVEAVRAGMGRFFVYDEKPVSRYPDVRAAEDEARAALRGLGGPPGNAVESPSRPDLIPVHPEPRNDEIRRSPTMTLNRPYTFELAAMALADPGQHDDVRALAERNQVGADHFERTILIVTTIAASGKRIEGYVHREYIVDGWLHG